MNIWITTFGSSGDVYPFIALGLELQQRGHAVTLLTGDSFAADVRNAGLDFRPWFSSQEIAQVINRSGRLRHKESFELLYRQILLPLAFVMYRMIAERDGPNQTALVASTYCFGARIAQERLGVPLVTVHLQPFCLSSAYDPPLPRPIRPDPWTPGWIRRALFNHHVRHTIGADLNAFRGTLGLPPAGRIFDRWLHSTDGVLGLFPEWFAAPQPDWPPETHLSGFPLYDAAAYRPLTDDVRQFLDAGEPPVIFTGGTDMKRSTWFFEAAMRACERLGCRGLFITTFRHQVPPNLPPGIRYSSYVPFSQVFPRSRAVVHHGGIGTTAQVMAAGVPHVVVPGSFDQPDHAMRIARLGVGRWIARRQYEADALSRILQGVLSDTRMSERARARARLMNARQALSTAGDVIEQVLSRSARTHAHESTHCE